MVKEKGSIHFFKERGMIVKLMNLTAIEATSETESETRAVHRGRVSYQKLASKDREGDRGEV